MGGQTALNTGLALERDGTLAKFGVEMIGAKADVIDKAEDRQRFREAMDKIGLKSPRSHQVRTFEQALEVLPSLGLPAIIRPSFTRSEANTSEIQSLMRISTAVFCFKQHNITI